MILTVPDVTLPVNVESLHGAQMAPKGTDVMSPEQCRAARAILRITVDELAKLSGISRMTIIRFETEQTASIGATIRHVKRALEDAGITFTGLGGISMDLETVRDTAQKIASARPKKEN